MSKNQKPTSRTAGKPSVAETQGDDVVRPVDETVDLAAAGTNTTVSVSGAAANSVSTEMVKPLGDDPTKPIEGEAATRSSPDITREVEAAASGTNSSETSQGDATGGAGHTASSATFAGVATAVELDDILAMAGADSLEQLLQLFELGKRMLEITELNGAGLADLIARMNLARDFSSGGAESFDEAMDMPTTSPVRVKATRDGFRRAGVVLSKAAHTFEAGELTVKQVAAMLDDPSITVEYL